MLWKTTLSDLDTFELLHASNNILFKNIVIYSILLFKFTDYQLLHKNDLSKNKIVLILILMYKYDLKRNKYKICMRSDY
jgi:hypothetical protein